MTFKHALCAHERQGNSNAHRDQNDHPRSALRPGPNQTLLVHNGAGNTVRAVQGAVWITEKNPARDIVLWSTAPATRLHVRCLELGRDIVGSIVADHTYVLVNGAVA